MNVSLLTVQFFISLQFSVIQLDNQEAKVGTYIISYSVFKSFLIQFCVRYTCACKLHGVNCMVRSYVTYVRRTYRINGKCSLVHRVSGYVNKYVCTYVRTLRKYILYMRVRRRGRAPHGASEGDDEADSSSLELGALTEKSLHIRWRWFSGQKLGEGRNSTTVTCWRNSVKNIRK